MKILKNADTVSSDKYYGVEIHTGCQYGFVARERYLHGDYVLRSLHNLTEGNGWSYVSPTTSLRDYLAKFLVCGDVVREFNTSRELFKWLLKNSHE